MPCWDQPCLCVVRSRSLCFVVEQSQPLGFSAYRNLRNPFARRLLPADAVVPRRPLTRGTAPLDQRLVRLDDRIVEGLNAIEGVSCRKPEGAFYAFANVQGLLGKADGDRTITTDLDLCDYLLDTVGVALVPGSAFGAPGYVRISYAASTEQIDEGLRRLGQAAAKLA